MSAPTSILFVCMGNICRSPLAENIFRHMVEERGLDGRFRIDSAGTGGWHAGAAPDPRVRMVAGRRGIPVTGSARQVRVEDFEAFDHILCADDDNLEDLLAMGAPPAKTGLLLEYCRDSPEREVPDPYYGGDDGFETVFKLVEGACDALLATFIDGSSASHG
ncbi:MAG: low molecular weight phosphotyrosine protein phosphatase [Phycisphaerales bacterium]|nr:low molecular weight phosphotyrosine protein phosphatase [Phycisphaerales bacterium]NNM25705.1 low molecular weight phosphotyrosine protein phosphatase [Phycisphaerales bacterium]